jgi:hypothetical protein
MNGLGKQVAILTVVNSASMCCPLDPLRRADTTATELRRLDDAV